MTIKPTVALRAMLVGGVAVFAKVAGAMKAAGGVKMGAAAAAMTAAATAAMSGSKQDEKHSSMQSSK
ncbi:uncharacterized protein LOC130762045 [Actinidia eriantha]|uniref:uncharacterized protein LOC130762045 n=1 Tax=Actinidia eriantha TaxID=165200 RepID=UPI00258EAD1A|nr:uncharacterized protein LOC130762045 [Actinidia eriantha]XP_057473651.1 uncharacterized protein LOC130762045 [Actinidia eriantha]